MKPLLINIVGPTATGKTALAVELARRLGTEIISADSRQVYREMHIGTAAPGPDERGGVPHHLLQHRSITENYTVRDFEREALATLEKLFMRYPAVIMVGGTGLYFRAVNRGLDPIPDVPLHIRQRLIRQWETGGLESLQARLRQVDPAYYATADIRNPRRVLRALEVWEATGKPFSSFRSGKPVARPFRRVWIGLTAPRDLLYQRIDRRTAGMIARGLEDEVRRLLPHRHLNALQTVGYREWFPYFDGKISRRQVQAEIAKNTRRYAKRQWTWFRANPQIHWWDAFQMPLPELVVQILTYIEKQVKA